MAEFDVTTLGAGRETDALLHARVFKRTDEAPPYSTQRSVAEWLAKEYELHVKPIHTISSAPKMVEGQLEEPEEGAVGFMVIRSVPPVGDGSKTDGLDFLGSAETFELAVARAVLVLEGVAFDPREVVRY